MNLRIVENLSLAVSFVISVTIKFGFNPTEEIMMKLLVGVVAGMALLGRMVEFP